MKGKTIRKLTAEQYIKIPVITWRNYREETRHESNPHLAPRLPWTSMNMLSKSWEIPHPHGLTMPSNTIKIPHIASHRPGVGGVGVSIDKCIIVSFAKRFSKHPHILAIIKVVSEYSRLPFKLKVDYFILYLILVSTFVIFLLLSSMNKRRRTKEASPL